MPHRLRRLAARTLIALGLALAAALVAACLVYPPRYVWRVFVWQDADVGDMARFPARRIAAAADAAELPAAPAPERVRAAFAAVRPGERLDDWLAANGTLGFVVLQRGRVVYEGYSNGHRRDDPATSFSVAKSILSAAVHQAVAEGRIASLDQPVTAYVPELRARDARFERVTLRHLLGMNSGMRYREFPFLHGDDTKTYYHPDLRRLAIDDTTIERPPAQAWLYDNHHPLLLGLVLERATKTTVSGWVEQRLWKPAGMPAPASWSLDSEASGFEKLESGFNARVLDYARFGQLFLDGGVAADGTRVLREADVRDATSPEGASVLDAMRAGLYYKHLWWGQRHDDGGYDFSARGNHGQFIYVSPRQRVVIARNGSRYGVPPGEWMRLFEALAARLGTEP